MNNHRITMNRIAWHCAVAGLCLGVTSLITAADEKEEKVVTEVAVQTGKVIQTTLHSYLVAYGTIEPEPAGASQTAASVRITSPLAGMITEAKAVEGARVTRGTVLFTLDNRVAKAAVEKAKQGVEKWREAEKFAELTAQREKALMATDGTSQKKQQEAEQQLAATRAERAAAAADLAVAETQLKLLRIEAPITGTLLRVNSKPGEAIDPTTVLAEVMDLDRLVAAINVPNANVDLLKPGQTVEIFADNAEQPAATSSLTFISPSVDPKTGTVLARVPVPKDKGLRPGQFVRARIVSGERVGKLAVPREAVYTDHDGQSTLSIVEGEVAKQKVVKVGLRDGDLVEVEGEGITEGATVVTVGSYALPKETKVRVMAKEEKNEKK